MFSLANTATVSTNRADYVYIADINGDGWLDIIADVGGAVYWQQYNSTSGKLGAFQVLLANYGQLTVADIDGDGALDIVAIGSTSNILWFRNTAVTPFNSSAGTVVGTVASIYNILVGDINGDGWVEIVGSSWTTGGVYVFSCVQSQTACAPWTLL